MTMKIMGRLHKDQQGFLSPIILFIAIALAYIIIWILNTGQVIYDKQRTQDTADAAALVHADWSARYLNIMAMNNVASSQATVILATSTAYSATLLELGVRSTAIGAKLAQYSGKNGWGAPNWRLPTGAPYCPGWGYVPIVGGLLQGACVAFQAFRGTMALEALGYIAYAGIKYNPPGLIIKSSEIISAMNSMNDYLVNSFPERVGNEGLNLVRLNKVDHLVYHPGCSTGDSCDSGKEGQGGDLPVEKGIGRVPAYLEMCKAMTDGTQSNSGLFTIRGEFEQRGFPAGKGPLFGGSNNRHIRDHVNDETGIDVQLPAFYLFYEAFGPAYYTSIPFGDLIEVFAGDLSWWQEILLEGAVEGAEWLLGIDLGVVNPFQLGIDSPPRYEDVQRPTENDFTRKFDDVWDQVCGGIGGGIASAVGVLPSPYWLKGRPVFGYLDPTNRIQTDQIEDYRALAVVSRQPRARLQTRIFKDRVSSSYAMAQSWVHNYTSFDLYTQDWMARLSPNSLAGDITAVSSTIKASPAADSYETLTQIFDQGGADGWSEVNSH